MATFSVSAARAEDIGNGVHRLPREVAGARAGAEDVAEAAVGERVGDGAELEIRHPGQLARLGRGEGERRGKGAEHGMDADFGDQPAQLGLRLGLVLRIAARELDRPAEQPAGGVALLGGQLQAAEALVAQQGEVAGEGVECAEAQFACRCRRLLRRGLARRNQGGKAAQQGAAGKAGHGAVPNGRRPDTHCPGPGWQPRRLTR
jgi:hypothetical protein